MEVLPIFERNRAYLNKVIGSVSDEQMLIMPPTFDNNIAWNLGHIIEAQQNLIYRQSGLEMLTDQTHRRRYAPGTSPADWESTPDLTALRALLNESTTKMATDMAAGRFQSYIPYTTSTGFELRNFADAFIFNLYHEGLHFGAIMALRNLVKGQ